SAYLSFFFYNVIPHSLLLHFSSSSFATAHHLLFVSFSRCLRCGEAAHQTLLLKYNHLLSISIFNFLLTSINSLLLQNAVIYNILT
ncbi:hypothetical protein VIGAN_05067800, partial [Vigna angularis var. angularis]